MRMIVNVSFQNYIPNITSTNIYGGIQISKFSLKLIYEIYKTIYKHILKIIWND